MHLVILFYSKTVNRFFLFIYHLRNKGKKFFLCQVDKDVKTQKGNSMNNISNLPQSFKEFVWMTLGYAYDPSVSWKRIAQTCSKCAAGLFDSELIRNIDGLTVIYAARMSGAAYELYHFKEDVGVYSNSEIDKLEHEIKSIIEEGAKRGLLNEICLPEEVVRRYIDISEITARLLWPKKTRELMDIKEALERLA